MRNFCEVRLNLRAFYCDGADIHVHLAWINFQLMKELRRMHEYAKPAATGTYAYESAPVVTRKRKKRGGR
jgi:hypothetical protein